jgi:hypothetical protein
LYKSINQCKPNKWLWFLFFKTHCNSFSIIHFHLLLLSIKNMPLFVFQKVSLNGRPQFLHQIQWRWFILKWMRGQRP